MCHARSSALLEMPSRRKSLLSRGIASMTVFGHRMLAAEIRKINAMQEELPLPGLKLGHEDRVTQLLRLRMASSCGVILCCAGIATLLTGCAQTPSNAETPSTRATDIQALKDNEAQWNRDFATKDVAKMTAHYADDAVMMAPGFPASSGADAIRKTMAELTADPALSLKFQTARVEVREILGTCRAWYQGSYQMTMTDPASKRAISDHWQLRDHLQQTGGWRMESCGRYRDVRGAAGRYGQQIAERDSTPRESGAPSSGISRPEENVTVPREGCYDSPMQPSFGLTCKLTCVPLSAATVLLAQRKTDMSRADAPPFSVVEATIPEMRAAMDEGSDLARARDAVSDAHRDVRGHPARRHRREPERAGGGRRARSRARGRAGCAVRCTAFPSRSRTTSTRRTCRPPAARWRSTDTCRRTKRR